MGEADHGRVLNEMRLMDDSISPIPITLPVNPNEAIKLDQDIALRDSNNRLLAIMTLEDIYEWDRAEVSEKVFGTQDLRHPLVAEMHRWGEVNISGTLRMLELPPHYDFSELRLTPAQTRGSLEGVRVFQRRCLSNP